MGPGDIVILECCLDTNRRVGILPSNPLYADVEFSIVSEVFRTLGTGVAGLCLEVVYNGTAPGPGGLTDTLDPAVTGLVLVATDCGDFTCTAGNCNVALDPLPTPTPSNTPTISISPTPSITPTKTPTNTPTKTPTATPTTPQFAVSVQSCCNPALQTEVYVLGNYVIGQTILLSGECYEITGPYAGPLSPTTYIIVNDNCVQCTALNPCATPAATETPTLTPTLSLTPTQTETLTPTPTFTLTQTETLTPTPTFTLTQTETLTPTPTPTFTLTQTETPLLPTPTFTPTETETPTPTPTYTQTPTETPTETPTPTQTPTPSPTEPYDVYLFSACCDGSVFRFENVSGTLFVGDTYYISLSLDFEGCATIIPYSATGPLYAASGVSFQSFAPDDCSVCTAAHPCATPTPTQTPTHTQTPTETPTLTPTPSVTPTDAPTSTPSTTPTITPTITQTETPTTTPTPSVTPSVTPTISVSPSVTPTISPSVNCTCVEYTLVNTSDIVFAQVQYIDCLYNDQQIEIQPFQSVTVCACQGSLVHPIEITVTLDGDCPPIPSQTRTPNPTATPTPTVIPCTEDDFCLYTQLSSLQTFNGNYVSGGTYNSRPYFIGDGTTTGYIYYTGTFWCLSDSLGGPCYLQGGLPCNSPCPDISTNYFNSGPCPTPTPSPINCNSLDFNAYFDCDYVPYPTPSPSIDCDLLDLNVTSFPVSPTPTPSTPTCNTSLDFGLSGYTQVTPTPSLSSTLEPTRTVDVGGQVTYRFIDNTFICVGSKVLLDCTSGIELYTSDPLVYSGTPLVAGTYFLGNIAGQYFCLQYLRDDDTYSANVSIDSVLNIYGNCVDCQVVLTPTPSITPTNTPTPSITPTATVTPSPTIESTTVYYVFETCSLNDFNNPAAVIAQTVPVNFAISVGQTFKDPEGQCWKYLGDFTSYYPSGVTNFVTYSSNYFNITPVVYSNCELCVGGQPTPVNCVKYDVELFRVGRPDGCGTYDAEESRVTATLYDSTGSVVVNATTNITVVFDLLESNCLGNSSISLPVVIPQGQSSGSAVYTSTTKEICPLTSLCDNLTRSVQGISSISPSTVTEC